jgi:ADP-glucose type glycogen/starch synthase
LEPLNDLIQKLYNINESEVDAVEISRFSRLIYTELRASQLQQLSPGRYLELQIQSIFPQEPAIPEKLRHELQQLLAFDGSLPPDHLFNVLDRLFNRREWRKLLKCNFHEETDWFNKEAFDFILIIFFKFSIFISHQKSGPDFKVLRKLILELLSNLRQTQAHADLSGYQVDDFLQRLQGELAEEMVLPAATGGDYAMKILFVTPEATPFAKTGGLADVAGSLPRALRQLGHDVRVVLPCHRSADRSGISLRKGRKSVEIPLGGIGYRGSLKQAVNDGVPYWFIDCPEFFDRDPLYGTPDGDYPDNSLRFGFFCRAVLEMIKRLDFRPDVIHIHDWQTCFIPVLLRTEYRHNPFYASISTLLTIHNLGYQGLFPISSLQQLGLPDSLTSPERMEYYGRISVLKGGINYSDLINTVSPTYCAEIQGPKLGHGFDGILRNRQEDLHGIINGLDQRSWDPALDTALPIPFNAENLNGKRACKRQLQKELGLDLRPDVPLLAVISRLDKQKGIELIEEAWEQLLARDIQFVLLGSGDHLAMSFWKEQQGKNPRKVSITLTFNEELSRRLYAASDLVLVPSLYEPCGLTQMIALHYGALPVVRRTGGLADTVIDATEDSRNGYGFVFDNPVPTELLAALDRALAIYQHRNRWRTLVKRGMGRDFSWTNSAAQYHELYTKARSLRQIPAA